MRSLCQRNRYPAGRTSLPARARARPPSNPASIARSAGRTLATQDHYLVAQYDDLDGQFILITPESRISWVTRTKMR